SNKEDIIVEADRGRLTQVISNLLSNALKFTKEGTVSIRTETEKKDSIQEVVVLIRDTGKGIDPEILPRLFTKFATKSDKGAGLGLFISKSIIQAHGGRIWVKTNAEGTGVTFAFSMPLNQ
ncbi:MAG: HAMP domain-containing sensor histidine kinase, partial [Nitrososphaeraceae archaeon]